MKDKSLTEVFYELAEKWETMTEIEKDHLAGDISGTRNIETRTFEEKFGRLTAMWRKMTDIEKIAFSHKIVEVRKIQYFKELMQLISDIYNVKIYKMLVAMLESWANMDEIEKEYITSRLFKDSSKDFRAFVDMLYKAVEFVADMDSQVKKYTKDIEVKDRNEYGKSDMLGIPHNDYIDHIKACREQIYKEIRELSGDNIPAQLKALQERLRDTCEAMKAVLEV